MAQGKKTRATRKKKATKKTVAKKKGKKRKPRMDPMQDRTEQMREMREQGYTFGAIASAFEVSRQRVHQLVSGARPEEETPKQNNNEPPAELLRGRGIQRKLEQYEKKETVGDRLVYKRMRRGWTIGQLSQESGIPYGVLSTYENNKAEPSCESLRKLCTALKISAHWLIFGEGFKRKKRKQAVAEA